MDDQIFEEIAEKIKLGQAKGKAVLIEKCLLLLNSLQTTHPAAQQHQKACSSSGSPPSSPPSLISSFSAPGNVQGALTHCRLPAPPVPGTWQRASYVSYVHMCGQEGACAPCRSNIVLSSPGRTVHDSHSGCSTQHWRTPV